jgi:hypothetical protein
VDPATAVDGCPQAVAADFNDNAGSACHCADGVAYFHVAAPLFAAEKFSGMEVM